jgi:hypothetical protein
VLSLGFERLGELKVSVGGVLLKPGIPCLEHPAQRHCRQHPSAHPVRGLAEIAGESSGEDVLEQSEPETFLCEQFRGRADDLRESSHRFGIGLLDAR